MSDGDLTVSFPDESILVLRGLGVQTSTSSSIYFGPAVTRFIPTTQIQDIVIHEAFRGFAVRFYLAIIVDGESAVVVVFPVGSHRVPAFLERDSADNFLRRTCCQSV
jgi:CO dehydrogenase/acetyl-CoA synthase gamma subunit (corrinoid Fe-S protein)